MLNSRFLKLSEVLLAHDVQIARFGGMHGVRDEGLPESALAQPEATFSGELLHSTIYEQAAAYLYHNGMGLSLGCGIQISLDSRYL